MSRRIVGVCERAISTTVNDVRYTESQSYSGVGVIKVHFQPSVQVDLAIAQVTALAQSVVHLMPPGTLPPYVLKYDASSVPIVQASLGGKGLSQTELYDLGQNFIRGQLATINGTSVPLPYGGSSGRSWWTWSLDNWRRIHVQSLSTFGPDRVGVVL